MMQINESYTNLRIANITRAPLKRIRNWHYWHKIRKFASPKGFTLIELILFIGMFSVILLVLTTFFAEIVQRQLEVETMSAVESDATYLVSKLKHDFEQADDVISPALEGETANQLILSINGVDHTYSLNGGLLELNDTGETSRLNSIKTTVSDLSFTRLGNAGGKPTIQVQLTIESITELNTGPENTLIHTTFGIQ